MQLPPGRVVFTTLALKDSEERLFPISRHRSRRIRKKLLRRHGGEFRKVPCMWRAGDVILAHPALRAEIERQLDAAGVVKVPPSIGSATNFWRSNGGLGT